MKNRFFVCFICCVCSKSGIKIIISYVLNYLSFLPHSLMFFLFAKLSKNKEAAKTFTFLNF